MSSIMAVIESALARRKLGLEYKNGVSIIIQMSDGPITIFMCSHVDSLTAQSIPANLLCPDHSYIKCEHVPNIKINKSPSASKVSSIIILLYNKYAY